MSGRALGATDAATGDLSGRHAHEDILARPNHLPKIIVVTGDPVCAPQAVTVITYDGQPHDPAEGLSSDTST